MPDRRWRRWGRCRGCFRPPRSSRFPYTTLFRSGHRLEVQTIGGVIVGGNGFRVAVDHDGLVTVFAHGQRRVHAAVVELDTLADTVRRSEERRVGKECRSRWWPDR